MIVTKNGGGFLKILYHQLTLVQRSFFSSIHLGKVSEKESPQDMSFHLVFSNIEESICSQKYVSATAEYQ